MRIIEHRASFEVQSDDGSIVRQFPFDDNASRRSICRPLKASPSMWAFIVAIIVFGLTLVISILVLFRYGMSDNQSLPPSIAAETTFTVGTLIAFAIAASHWLPQLGW
jgi:Ni/Fe-hydrogenase subunit HybB-like protein